jgi:hypothetical protein
VRTADEARLLLDSIALTRAVTLPDGTIGEAPDLVGLRDHALISAMIFCIRPHQRRAWHARRGLLPAEQALVGASP